MWDLEARSEVLAQLMEDVSMDPIDATYLPFSTEVLREHLAKADSELFESALGDPDSDETKRVGYYEASARRYHEFLESEKWAKRKGMAVSAMKRPRQIEKDERFWTAACLLNGSGST